MVATVETDTPEDSFAVSFISSPFNSVPIIMMPPKNWITWIKGLINYQMINFRIILWDLNFKNYFSIFISILFLYHVLPAIRVNKRNVLKQLHLQLKLDWHLLKKASLLPSRQIFSWLDCCGDPFVHSKRPYYVPRAAKDNTLG